MNEFEREVELICADRRENPGRSMLGVGLLMVLALVLSFIGLMVDVGIESGAISKVGKIELRVAVVLDVDYIPREGGQVMRVIKYRWLEEARSKVHWQVSQYRPEGEADSRNGLEPGDKIVFKDGEPALWKSEESVGVKR